MRILIVIPHYFGPADPANSSPVIASYIDPLARIAGLSEMLTSLHRNFGPYRSTFEGVELSDAHPNTLDIVLIAMQGRTILPELGLDPDIYTVEYVEGPPTRIPFATQRLMKERLGRYDIYGYMEDDLAIHDPAFFRKLAWFQRTFGPRALLMPTRVETASTGTPGKVVIDPRLDEPDYARFRRPGQREELRGTWDGEEWTFRLPSNPHSGCYFLSDEQLGDWIAHPSFDDRDASWVGPVESAATLAPGKVFDIYKTVSPDPFFLEIHHFGARYAARNPPRGRRYGEPPLLAIAQNAVRAVRSTAQGNDDVSIARWLAEGTAGDRLGRVSRDAEERPYLESQIVEFRARMDTQFFEIAQLKSALEASAGEVQVLQTQADVLTGEVGRLQAAMATANKDIDRLRAELAVAGRELERREHTLRWLVPSTLREMLRRITG